jgi:hypothetical protein
MIVSRTIDGGTKRYVEYMEKEWLRTNDIEDAFFVDSGLTYDSTPTVTITGLDHLEGETVKVLGDGVQLADATVSGGSITIVSSSVVQVGLSYDALLQSMRFESGGADGVAQGKTKRFTRCVIRLDQVGAGLLYGHEDDEANMDAVQLTAGALTDGDTDSLAWPKGYEQAGRIALKHTQPLPCAITAILPQVVVQDR